MDAWTEVIKAAAVSPLGIAALALIIGCTVALRLVLPSDRPVIRLGALALVLVSGVSLAAAAIYSAEPTVLARPAAPAPSDKKVETSSADAVAEFVRVAHATRHGADNRPALVQRMDCGRASTPWVNAGAPAPDPCPAGCAQGEIIATTYRVEGFPPRAQERRLYQCWRR